MHPSRPQTLFMQKHWDVMRSDDGGDPWREISGNLPSDFGFPIAVHAHEPETVYVVPITSDSQHFPPDGRLRVYRSRTGGDDWEALDEGTPAAELLRDVLRDAMAVDSLDPTAASTSAPPAGRSTPPPIPATPGHRSSRPAAGALGRGADPRMIRVVLPGPLAPAGPLRSRDQPRCRTHAAGVLDALEQRYPALRGTLRDPATGKRRAFVRFFACEQDLSHDAPDSALPPSVAEGREPFLIVGAMAGG